MHCVYYFITILELKNQSRFQNMEKIQLNKERVDYQISLKMIYCNYKIFKLTDTVMNFSSSKQNLIKVIL